MAKKLSVEQEFQEWLPDYRAGTVSGPLLSARTDPEDKLRKLWKDWRRYQRRFEKERRRLEKARSAQEA